MEGLCLWTRSTPFLDEVEVYVADMVQRLCLPGGCRADVVDLVQGVKWDLVQTFTGPRPNPCRTRSTPPQHRPTPSPPPPLPRQTTLSSLRIRRRQCTAAQKVGGDDAFRFQETNALQDLANGKAC